MIDKTKILIDTLRKIITNRHSNAAVSMNAHNCHHNDEGIVLVRGGR